MSLQHASNILTYVLRIHLTMSITPSSSLHCNCSNISIQSLTFFSTGSVCPHGAVCVHRAHVGWHHGLQSLLQPRLSSYKTGMLKHSSLMITRAETKWPPFRRRQILSAFPWMKNLNFKWNFIETCSLGSNLQCGSIGSDDGLAQNRRQAIIWINDGLGYWRIHASLSLDEFITWTTTCCQWGSLEQTLVKF